MKIKGQLLSEYFVEEGIKETEDWKKLDDKSIKILFKEIKKLYFDFYFIIEKTQMRPIQRMI